MKLSFHIELPPNSNEAGSWAFLPTSCLTWLFFTVKKVVSAIMFIMTPFITVTGQHSNYSHICSSCTVHQLMITKTTQKRDIKFKTTHQESTRLLSGEIANMSEEPVSNRGNHIHFFPIININNKEIGWKEIVLEKKEKHAFERGMQSHSTMQELLQLNIISLYFFITQPLIKYDMIPFWSVWRTNTFARREYDQKLHFLTKSTKANLYLHNNNYYVC